MRIPKRPFKGLWYSFWTLENNLTVDWLLNYRGGSFLIENETEIEKECIVRGVSYEIITNAYKNNYK